MIIGKLYEISNSYEKAIFSNAFDDMNRCYLNNVIGHIHANDIVLVLGVFPPHGILKILTSAGVAGYCTTIGVSKWQLVEAI
jgi:hypothetical protein